MLEAIRGEKLDEIRVLLADGADPNGSMNATAGSESRPEVYDRGIGKSPLFVVVRTRTLEMVKLVLEAGANPNGREIGTADWGQTPLMLAAAAGHVDLVKELLSHGADPSLR